MARVAFWVISRWGTNIVSFIKVLDVIYARCVIGYVQICLVSNPGSGNLPRNKQCSVMFIVCANDLFDNWGRNCKGYF